MYVSQEDDFSTVSVNLVDATKGNTDIVVHQSYIFAGQLSFEKLEESWNTLVSAWPIIWARTRVDEDSPSGLSYYIPSEAKLKQIREEALHSIDPKRKPFYCLDLSDRLLSSYFGGLDDPNQDEIYTTLAPKSFDFDIIAKANSPKYFSDILTGDYPLISVQVTRFADATIITRNNSHIYGDGFTAATVLNAWQDILNGKDAPPPLEDLGYDPFLQFAPPPKPLIPWKETSRPSIPPAPRGWYILSWKQKFDLISRLLYDLLIVRPEKTMQARYLFIPISLTDKLQEQAKEDLAKSHQGKTDIRIGKSDVLYAWLLKHTHATLPRDRMSTAMSIVNLKGRPPPGITLPRHKFFCSALPIPLQPLQIGELLEMPLGELALHIRKSHQIYLDPDLQKKSIAFHLHHILWKRPSGQIPFFCPTDHFWSGLSDLRALRYFQLNFKGALPDDDVEGDAKLIGQHCDMSCKMSKRDRWLCLGDSDQGTWFVGHLSQDQWDDPQSFGRYEQRHVA